MVATGPSDTAPGNGGSTTGGAGEERLVLVDLDDRVVGAAPRSRVRAENLLHRAVAVIVLDRSGRLLVHRRTATKDVFPGLWDATVGGTVADGESYAETARREAAEELGVGVGAAGTPLAPRFRHRYLGPTVRCWTAVYETVWDGPVRPQPEEVAEVRRVHPDRLFAEVPRTAMVPDGLEIVDRWLRDRSTGGPAARP